MNKPIEAIYKAFSHDRPILMPYFTLGYPDYESSLNIIQACVESGAEMMELGLPFSDPLADGPTIQHSTQVALENGLTTNLCFKAVEELRNRGVEIPFILMGYYNPILAYGLEPFVEKACSVGANGFIIPDLPPEEGAEFEQLCIQYGMGLSYLLSPNSPVERTQLLLERSRGFAYLVSVIGVTGARNETSPTLKDFTNRVRRLSPPDMPLVVGFGISTPDQVRSISQFADGIIVGSALINAVDQSIDPVKKACDFVSELHQALE
ncbi:MAG: tryptophan synthase subunit alpha [Chloroflexi bacterium]|nr:tryptophan synthase subunit alpha [Chloroflexota bacterium]